MKSYGVKFRRKTDYVDKPKLCKTKNNEHMIVIRCAVCKIKKLIFVSKKDVQNGSRLAFF